MASAQRADVGSLPLGTQVLHEAVGVEAFTGLQRAHGRAILETRRRPRHAKIGVHQVGLEDIAPGV